MLPNDTNYMLYRLTWDEENQKYKKKPCRLDGTSLQKDEAVPTAARHAITVPDGCALGYWLTEEAGLFFIDLDECVVGGNLSPDAAMLAAPFVNAGCFFEGSSSGRGAHIIGAYHGQLPPHSNKRPKVHHYEFYTRDRGIALNPAGGVGTCAVDATPLLVQMLTEYFPPRAVAEELHEVGERRPEWRGPEDDDELIRRMLASRGSAAVAFGTKAGFADMWEGRVEKNSESDMALASHLAFWTGCDVPRIERLMMRSALVREKWHERRRDKTYLRVTVEQCCATTNTVYQEPEKKNTLVTVVGPKQTDIDLYKLTDDTIATINNAGTFRELMENVVPGVGTLGLPVAHAERVVTALMDRLKIFNSNLPKATVRQLVSPPNAARAEAAGSVPEWFMPFCYVKSTEQYFNTLSGSVYSAEAFRTEYARFMPMKQNGDRECPVKWARERWNIVTVDAMEYRPDQPTFFEYAGKHFVNTYMGQLLPPLAVPSLHCQGCIEAFKQHMLLICGRREGLRDLLIQWLAHNVQKPGHKIRWSPLIKGVPGDGKSIVGDLMFASMGPANVKMTSTSTLTNSGGFTDWATGKAVNFIEEIRLEGKERHKLYNAMKIFVGDTRIELNRKGKASGDTLVNITNHWANTNYGDGIPVDDGERRWLVIFSPYASIHDAYRDKGLPDEDALVRHFKMLGTSMRAEPGAWRAWLMGVDISTFDPDARALSTPERDSMKLMASDSQEQVVLDILEQGGYGITKDCFSSSALQGRVTIECPNDPPRHNSWNKLLVRLGYRQMVKTVYWNGKMHRIWAKNELPPEIIREILDKTSVVG